MEQNMNDITDTHRQLALPAVAHWLDAKKRPQAEACGPALLNRELYKSPLIREGHRYPRQRNYYGMYYFGQLERHIWHESLLEANSLRWLDRHEMVKAVAAQPFKLTFADGTTHVPDYIALHDHRRQVAYDVKPPKHVAGEAFQLQAAKTKAVCDAVGWGYRVLGELPPVPRMNLEFLSAFQHPGFYPGAASEARLFAALVTPISIREAADALGLDSRAQGRSALFHLVWHRVASIDLNAQTTDSTLVERGPRANA